MKTMIDQSLAESKKKKDSQVAEMAAKTVMEVKEMCAVELQDGSV